MKNPFLWSAKIVLTLVISFGLGGMFTLLAEGDILRSPRTDATSVPCTGCGIVTCPASGDLDTIRACICQVNRDLDVIESKIDEMHTEMTESFDGTWTALDECCDSIHISIDEMHTEMTESFIGTWTAIEECCIAGALGNPDDQRICDTYFGDPEDQALRAQRVDDAEFTVFQWLKTIYAKIDGLEAVGTDCVTPPLP